MKRAPTALALLVLLLVNVCPAGASAPVGALASTAPPTIAISISQNPLTLDPTFAEDEASLTVIEQLFAGLVDYDDATGEIRPELAESWVVSSSGTVYTFTLRDAIKWSDGTAITADDVRYAILRTLNPDATAPYAWVLYPIKNAQAYRERTISDETRVGVEVVDPTHLKLTLEEPGIAGLYALGHWAARPLPRSVIDAHPNDWTALANIVTSGAYRLTEWVASDRLTLEKNATYYDAANVQIERVTVKVANANTAWQMYVNGDLDTAELPLGTMPDGISGQELHEQSRMCTYYYGFSTAAAPFDNVLVRKAFAAAVDRRGLVVSVANRQLPALTFTAPGVVGHVDGFAEAVGIGFDPVAAANYLTQAGYPGGAGLPAITLWYNEDGGHQEIAAYIRQNWQAYLGVTVNLRSLPWDEYPGELSGGDCQVWRMGWCGGYPDAVSFLGDAMAGHTAYHGGWSNAVYNATVALAKLEQDPALRRLLYKQAEQILVETDAVMIPIYYHTRTFATKPYLERDYGVAGSDISGWRLAIATAAIGTSGGSLTSTDGSATIAVPTVPAVTDFSVAPATGMPPAPELAMVGGAYSFGSALHVLGGPDTRVAAQIYTISISYSDAEADGVVENSIALYYWDGLQWVREATSTLNAAGNIATATTTRLGLWALIGTQLPTVYLPMAMLRD